jgi:glycerol-3-phosphate dehydrogenase
VEPTDSLRRVADTAAQPGFDRGGMLDRLAAETFDLLVVGGGITGAGVALDAAARGLRTALVEADDFAAGTSSRSSKLIHGGLRYLQQGDVRLVYQALRERKRLRRNAPHLVRILPFLIPIFAKDGLIPRRVARALGTAMWLYDLTGGWRIGKLHRRVSADEAHRYMPTIARDRLAGGYVYYDATVDDARLVLTIIRTAAAHGAAAANRCRVTGFERDAGGRVVAATVDAGDGRTLTVRAQVFVNATGVWADEVRAMASGTLGEPTIRPAKGVHLTVPWSLVRNDIAAVIPVPGDKRSLFVVPWSRQADGTFKHAYIGTTDTDYEGRLDDPPCTADDVDYVLRALNAAVTTDVGRDDITGVWAGLRPLVHSAASDRTADLSRRHRVTIGDGGVIAISGGKLTTYREMAEDTVDVVVEQLGSKRPPWRRVLDRIGLRRLRRGTRSLSLLGAAGFKEAPAGSRDAHLADRYGSLRGAIEQLVAADPTLGEPLVPGLPYTRGEAVHAVRHEMATTLVDVVTRRTRSHLLDRAATLAAAPAIADLLAAELDWDRPERDRQLAAYEQLVARELADAAAPVADVGAAAL